VASISGINSHSQIWNNPAGVTAGWNSKLSIVSYLSHSGYNNITSTGDVGIIWGHITGVNGNLCICPHTSGTSGLKITSNGSVGIGTSTIRSTAWAQTLLQVSGAGLNNQFLHTVSDGATNEKHWGIGPNGTGYYIYLMSDDGTSTTNSIRCIRSAMSMIAIYLNANTVYLSGYTTNGALSVINAPAGQLSTSSDRRMKENIIYYDQPNNIEKIKKLKPATFNFIGTKDKMLGFIAQDLEEVIPEAVDGKKYEYEWKKDSMTNEPILDENGNLILDYDKPRYRGVSDRAIIAIMVKAMQEQQQQIEFQQSTIQSLEQRLALLEQRFA
jgi:hypothetical protein